MASETPSKTSLGACFFRMGDCWESRNASSFFFPVRASWMACSEGEAAPLYREAHPENFPMATGPPTAHTVAPRTQTMYFVSLDFFGKLEADEDSRRCCRSLLDPICVCDSCVFHDLPSTGAVYACTIIWSVPVISIVCWCRTKPLTMLSCLLNRTLIM